IWRPKASGGNPREPYSAGSAFEAWSQTRRTPASSGPGMYSNGGKSAAARRVCRASSFIFTRLPQGRVALKRRRDALASANVVFLGEFRPHVDFRSAREAAQPGRALFRARRRRGRDGDFAHLRAPRRRGPFRERVLARRARPSAPLRMPSSLRAAREAGAAFLASRDPRGAGLLGRPLLLAPCDLQDERRQRNLLRDHGTDLGRRVRLAHLPAQAYAWRPCRARSLPDRRGGAHLAKLRVQADGRPWRRVRRRDRRLFRPLLPRR